MHANTKKMWATTIEAGLEPLSGLRVFGYARRRKDWVKVSQGHRDWGASINPSRVSANISTSKYNFGQKRLFQTIEVYKQAADHIARYARFDPRLWRSPVRLIEATTQVLYLLQEHAQLHHPAKV